MISKQMALFVAAGGTAAAANFGSRILLSRFMPYAAAIVLAYCVGMATAFALNRLFVFKQTSNTIRTQLAWFIAINLVAVVQTLGISLVLAKWLFPLTGMTFHPETLAHAVGVIVPVFTSYLGHKHLSFRSDKA